MSHIVLAGGGSAGHTSPMIATAERLLEHPNVTVSCVGTADKLEAIVVPEAGLEIDFIDRVVLPRKPSADLLTLPVRLAGAIRQTRQILRERQARAVVGFGGFASTPAYFAAKSMGLPFFVQEQNAVAGVANKVGARLGGKVAASYPDCGLPHARVLGLPLRRAIVEFDRAAHRAQAREELGLRGDRRTVLVSGGSLGARSINSAVSEGIDSLLAANIDVVHVWGRTNYPDDARVHEDATTGARYVPLAYLSDMTTGYAASDGMVGRAGSNTVWELATMGLPALLFPLPHGNGEQERNAQFLLDAGGCLVFPDEQSSRLCASVITLIHDDEHLAQMAAGALSVAKKDAAQAFAQWIVEEL